MTSNGNQKLTKRLVIIGVVCFFVVIIIVSVFNRLMISGDKFEHDGERTLWPVHLETVKPVLFIEKIEASGIIKPLETAQLSPEVSAKVLSVKADLGDHVKKGQALVRLDGSAYHLNYKSAQAQYEQAKSQAKLAMDHFKRQEELAAKGHVSQEELDQARSSADTAVAAEKSAKAAYNIAGRNLGETTIRAPFAGRISSRSVSPGNLVSPGLPIITVVQDDVMKVDLALSENEIKMVKAGMIAIIKVPSIPKKIFEGKVTRIGVAADQSSGSFPVRIEIQNDNYELLGGMRCKVSVQLVEVEDAIAIHRDYIVKLHDTEGVFVAHKNEDGYKAQFVEIEKGNRSGETHRILSGLNAEDVLVIVGQHSLKDGSQIEPLKIDGEAVKAPDSETEGQED